MAHCNPNKLFLKLVYRDVIDRPGWHTVTDTLLHSGPKKKCKKGVVPCKVLFFYTCFLLPIMHIFLNITDQILEHQ